MTNAWPQLLVQLVHSVGINQDLRMYMACSGEEYVSSCAFKFAPRSFGLSLFRPKKPRYGKKVYTQG